MILLKTTKINNLIALILFLGSVALILKFIKKVPYFYISIIIFIILLFIAIKTKKSTNCKAVLVQLATVVLLLGFAELYQMGWQGLILREEGGFRDGVHHKYDELRGYAMESNSKIRSKLFLGNEIIYDVLYTTNQYGLRVSPHDLNPSLYPPTKRFNNVAFFGCSFIFGEGVNDNETLPYLFEEKSKGQYRFYNLAVEGYGPHQMLRMLETGFLQTVITDKQPSMAIYLLIPQHTERSSCKYPYFIWGTTGPKYKLNSSGGVEYVGKFNDSLFSKIKFNLFHQLAKCHLLSNNYRFKQILGWNVTDDDEKLLINIIYKSKEIFTKQYGGKFYVILWTDNVANYRQLFYQLAKNQIPVINTEEIFNRFNDPIKSYLIKADGHPNKLAYERIASYMLNYLEKNP